MKKINNSKFEEKVEDACYKTPTENIICSFRAGERSISKRSTGL
jgi:hypothetical protein